MTPQRNLELYVIYEKPSDYPDGFVVRLHVATAEGSYPTDSAITCSTSEEARLAIPDGLVCITRSEGDDKTIVETWL
jgi:hypothetical protein